MMALAPAHILNIKSIFVALIAALLTAPDVVLSRKHHLEVRVRVLSSPAPGRSVGQSELVI